MALTDLNTKINQYRDEAAQARANHAHTIEQIRNNPRLSPDGKKEQIARSYRETANTISALAAKETEALEQTRHNLERTLFGQYATDPTSLLAYRDAQERVARLTLDDRHTATELMRTAKISGDTHLASALLGKALNNGWDEITDTYTATHPDKATHLRDLSDVMNFQNNIDIDFQRTADYSFHKPAELTQHTDNNIERLADNSDERDRDTPLDARALEQWAVDNG